MFLVGTCVFTSLVDARYQAHDDIRASNRLTLISCIYHLVFCLAVPLVHAVHFG